MTCACVCPYLITHVILNVSNCIHIQIYSYLRSAHGVCICTYHKPMYYYVFFCYMLTMYSLLNEPEIKHSPLKIMLSEGQIRKIYNMVKSSSTKTIGGGFLLLFLFNLITYLLFFDYLLMVFIITFDLYRRDYSRN